MIPIPPGVRVWLSTGHTDLRKGMAGLALQVQEALGRDPYKGDLYVFRGRRGQQASFNIRIDFANREGGLSVAPAVRAKVPGRAVPARKGSLLHSDRRAAGPLA